MLRGVNRQIIEINNTENSYFEKAILYVRPECAEIGEGKLHENATSFLSDIASGKQLIKSCKKATPVKKKKIVFSLALTTAAVALCAFIVFKCIF